MRVVEARGLDLCEDGCVFTSIFSQTRGSASAAEPPGCSSPSLSLLDAAAAAAAAAAALLLASERLRFGTRPDELAPPARVRLALSS